MVKFGLLYLRQDRLGGQQIVPQEWVRASTLPRYLTYEDIGHDGRHWWVSTLAPDNGGLDDDKRFYFAMGLGGAVYHRRTISGSGRRHDERLVRPDLAANALFSALHRAVAARLIRRVRDAPRP